MPNWPTAKAKKSGYHRPNFGPQHEPIKNLENQLRRQWRIRLERQYTAWKARR